ncbi:MAG TPA: 2-hydroxychromene-2-carboxylate isomerase [Caulobacteraceae bacterium]|nr:2-hydroxychromene-2-carboxylate isomerase [Caulobacteraceae bacterium]
MASDGGGEASIEVFFDCSSPWTYLAFENLQPLAAEVGAAIVWRPILVGGVFNAVNPSVYASRADPTPAKARYMLKDLQDWARIAGLKIRMPPSVFPVNSVKAMRACLVLEAQGKLVAFARAVFQAYWGEDLDISRDQVLIGLCERLGLAGETVLAAAAGPEIKAALRANTDELIARGGFGSPTMFVGQDMYFGNDRLALVRAALTRAC